MLPICKPTPSQLSLFGRGLGGGQVGRWTHCHFPSTVQLISPSSQLGEGMLGLAVSLSVPPPDHSVI